MEQHLASATRASQAVRVAQVADAHVDIEVGNITAIASLADQDGDVATLGE